MSCLEKLFSLVPLKDIEQGAQDQIYTALKHPFLVKLAIMPDVHKGYSLPVGGVALLDNVISPAYVGYDIGCGMCSIITMVPFATWIINPEQTYKEIMTSVPNGVGQKGIERDYPTFKSACGDKNLDKKVNNELFRQLGTLGGGNHFIELGSTQNGMLAITIHSGSRNPGHSVGMHYMRLSKKNDTNLPGDFLNLHSDLGQAYLADMSFMLQYALDNRLIMMQTVLNILGIGTNLITNQINENHNHAEISSQYGENMVLHRKGATPADKDQYGIIPGNMRDGVYITQGLGNDDYLSSSSHGAGRKGSRKWANEKFTIPEFRKNMEGIFANINKTTLDENPLAYKDIHQVISSQEGKVITVIDHIQSRINIKS